MSHPILTNYHLFLQERLYYYDGYRQKLQADIEGTGVFGQW